jgi:hypothetical protein
LRKPAENQIQFLAVILPNGAGMEAHHGKQETGMGGTKFIQKGRSLRIHVGQKNLLHAFYFRPVEHGLQILTESGIIQMGVSINEHPDFFWRKYNTRVNVPLKYGPQRKCKRMLNAPFFQAKAERLLFLRTLPVVLRDL